MQRNQKFLLNFDHKSHSIWIQILISSENKLDFSSIQKMWIKTIFANRIIKTKMFCVCLLMSLVLVSLFSQKGNVLKIIQVSRHCQICQRIINHIINGVTHWWRFWSQWVINIGLFLFCSKIIDVWDVLRLEPRQTH